MSPLRRGRSQGSSSSRMHMQEHSRNNYETCARGKAGGLTEVGSRRSRRGLTRACQTPGYRIQLGLNPLCPSRGSQCRCSWVRESTLQHSGPISLVLAAVSHPEASKSVSFQKTAECEIRWLVTSRQRPVLCVCQAGRSRALS